MVQILFRKRHWPRADVCPLHHPSYTCAHRTRYVGGYNLHYRPLFTCTTANRRSYVPWITMCVHSTPTCGSPETADSRPALVHSRSRTELQNRTIGADNDDCMLLFKAQNPGTRS